jgi:hypothetical protein
MSRLHASLFCKPCQRNLALQHGWSRVAQVVAHAQKNKPPSQLLGVNPATTNRTVLWFTRELEISSFQGAIELLPQRSLCQQVCGGYMSIPFPAKLLLHMASWNWSLIVTFHHCNAQIPFAPHDESSVFPSFSTKSRVPQQTLCEDMAAYPNGNSPQDNAGSGSGSFPVLQPDLTTSQLFSIDTSSPQLAPGASSGAAQSRSHFNSPSQASQPQVCLCSPIFRMITYYIFSPVLPPWVPIYFQAQAISTPETQAPLCFSILHSRQTLWLCTQATLSHSRHQLKSHHQSHCQGHLFQQVPHTSQLIHSRRQVALSQVTRLALPMAYLLRRWDPQVPHTATCTLSFHRSIRITWRSTTGCVPQLCIVPFANPYALRISQQQVVKSQHADQYKRQVEQLQRESSPSPSPTGDLNSSMTSMYDSGFIEAQRRELEKYAQTKSGPGSSTTSNQSHSLYPKLGDEVTVDSLLQVASNEKEVDLRDEMELNKRIVAAHEFVDRAKKFKHADSTLWQLRYVFPNGPNIHKKTHCLVSSKGKREPLESRFVPEPLRATKRSC